MIPKDCKRLAEVDFPIADVSRYAAREKTIRHGLPSALHLWWARRPLASSRAVLLALLWPDPCDPQCPEGFRRKARDLLPRVQGKVGPTNEDLRNSLLKFIGAFANWDLAANESYLEVSRALVKAAYGEEPPLIVDSFAGGGSIPLEALRLDCEAFASDLNPVACLILKVTLEEMPRHGPKLIEELRRVGAEIDQRAKIELADLYPKDSDKAAPIAYLWARTVRCESPNCGAEIPLMRSFWLCKKTGRRRALRHNVVRRKSAAPSIEFEIFEPKTEKEVTKGTVRRARATCLACSAVLPPERVRAQIVEQNGGADTIFDSAGHRTGGARMLAVVMLRSGERGRQYRVPEARDYVAVRKAQEQVATILEKWEQQGKQGFCPFPDEPLRRVPISFGVINVWVYGMLRWGDMFTARQKVALLTLIQAVQRVEQVELRETLALVISKLSELACAVCAWEPVAECPRHIFGRQAIGMAWDFGEGVLNSSSSGSFIVTLENAASALNALIPLKRGCSPQIADAAKHPLPDQAANVWFIDPPYYDSVPYSYISDFFYVWIKRTLGWVSPNSDPRELTPKSAEIVAYTPEGSETSSAYALYERRMTQAFSEGMRILQSDGIGSVVFAHKTTEGWEALLSGLIGSGWTITASWPIATEMASRLRARESAALGTSVHLICRPRSDTAAVGDWAHVLRELPKRVGDWMDRLQDEGVRGADLVFACIGPALEVFSRYAKVETADGREVALAEYLEKVWEVVGRSALAQVLGTAEAKARNGAASAVEEDSRLTALFLWTLQATNGEAAEDTSDEGEDEDAADDQDEDEDEGLSRGKAKGFTLVFDVVRRFAQPLGIELSKWEGRIIETKKGVVRLLPIAERAKQLFGEDGAQAVAARLEREVVLGPNPLQGMLFPEIEAAPKIRGRGTSRRGGRMGGEFSDQNLAASREATTLDRVHAAMLLQASGRTNALRALLKTEQERGSDFLRLANALSTLYPKGSEEKRLLEAMVMAIPR